MASKITQITPHATKPEAQINQLILGVCDYLPHHLKFKHSLKIAIDGDPRIILNTILWSEYFYKTLLKECQQHFFLTYCSEGEKAPTAIFIKHREKIYKLEENMEWNSQLRKDMLLTLQKQQKVVIQTYSKTGTIRSICVLFGEYVQGEGVDLLLKLVQSQPSNMKSNEDSKGTYVQNLVSEDKLSVKVNTKTDKGSQKNTSSYSTLKSKKKKNVQSTNKENSKASDYKIMLQVKSKKVLQKKPSNTIIIHSNVSRTQKESKRKNKPQKLEYFQQVNVPKQPYVGRQRIISKLLSTKQQALVILKQKMAKQENDFQMLIKAERAEHEQQIQKITQSIKSVLEQYQTTRVSQQNQIFYLKERVKSLETALSRRQIQAQEHLIQLKSLMNEKRQAQMQLKKLNTDISRLKSEYQSQRILLYEQNKRLCEQLRKQMQKSADYQKKYEDLVNLMRRNIPDTLEERSMAKI